MTFMQNVIEFFQSIFMASSPEVKKRQALKKIEAELKDSGPLLYKNGMIQVNVAEALRILFFNTKPIGDLLAETICSDNVRRNKQFEEQLLLTGFDEEAQQILINLEYSNRKSGAEEAQSLTRYFENEHHQLEKVVKQLNSQEFIKIDGVLNKIKQLNDICRYNYITTLRLFDTNFTAVPNYTPSFAPIPPDLIEMSLQDLYYVFADLDISTSLSRAIIALYQLSNGQNSNQANIDSLLENLKKIQSVSKHVFSKKILLSLIRLAKKDPNFVPTQASYKGNRRQEYADYLENRFQVDESRLKNELQDERIISLVHEIFQDKPLLNVACYNQETNTLLKQSTPCSFNYILPMQVLKTFMAEFYDTHAKTLLNDIVIEGFFNNPAYKTDFSTVVFACNESSERIAQFEQSFSRGGEFDEAIITGLISDSHKDSGFINQLKDTIDKINKRAKELLQAETNNIFMMSKLIDDIIVEAKKPSSDVITNLKVLMISSRNRSSADAIEKQAGEIKIFLEIMKNYVIIGNIEKKNKA